MSIDLGSSPRRRSEDPKRTSPGHRSLDAELYGLGRVLRHLQPPGGTESGVFDAYRLPPAEVWTPRRKVKDYLKSNVFLSESGESSPPRPVTPLAETTHYKLFAEAKLPPTPSRTHNRMKSSVFDEDPKLKTPPVRPLKNPITGDFCGGEARGRRKSRVARNPITFEGIGERKVPSRCKQPPGGRCSLILEYVE